MKKQVEKKIIKLLQQKTQPLKGNTRSFSNRAVKRNFHNNKQRFKIGSFYYYLSVKDYKKYWTIWQKNQ